MSDSASTSEPESLPRRRRSVRQHLLLGARILQVRLRFFLVLLVAFVVIAFAAGYGLGRILL